MSEMDAYTGSTKCTQPFEYANEVRSTIDWLDLAVDRKITDIWVVLIASPPVPPAVFVIAEIYVHAETPKCLQRYDHSLIDSLDLAVDRRISVVGLRSLPRREHAVSFRSSVELSVHWPVYGTVNTSNDSSRNSTKPCTV
ncbi:hypothetical protein QTP88_027992 [Uroleucon formosanum]